MYLRSCILLFLLTCSCRQTNALKDQLAIEPEPSQKNSFSLADGLDDLNFMKKAIEENHPGMHNAEDPGFKKILASAYNTAHAQLTINPKPTPEQVKGILRKFSKAFNDPHLEAWFSESNAGQSQEEYFAKMEFVFKKLDDGRVWISLPTFQYDRLNELQKVQLHKIVDGLAGLRNAPAIIFDMRGNGGGNSGVGTALSKSLFGEEYWAQEVGKAKAKEYVEWRASPENLRMLKSYFEAELKEAAEKKRPINSDYAQYVEKLFSEMQQSINNKVPLYREPHEVAPVTNNKVASPMKAKIFAIIDKNDGSAALDFLDELKILDPQATFVGETTGADRLYMDVNRFKLPNGGNFMLPMKVYRGRSRGDNVPHQPDIHTDVKDIKGLLELSKIPNAHYLPRPKLPGMEATYEQPIHSREHVEPVKREPVVHERIP